VALASVGISALVLINAASVSAAPPPPPGTCPATGEPHGDCRSDYNHDQHCLEHPIPVAPFCSAAQPEQSSAPASSQAVVAAPVQPIQSQVPPVESLAPAAEVEAAATPAPPMPRPSPREPILRSEAPQSPPQVTQSAQQLPPITTVATPLTVSTSLKLIGINIFIALILAALLALPAELINSTIKENYTDITKWLGFTKGKMSGLHAALHHLPSHFALVFFVVVAGVLYTFLDPAASFNLTTAAELVGLIVALAVITGTHDLARNAYVKRRFKRRGRLITFPAGIIFAVGLVVVSRIFNFEPGFIFGLMTGIAFSDGITEREDGHGLWIASLLVLAVSFAAWFVWIPVKSSVDASHDPAFIMVALDTLLATVWVAGVQSVVFSLIPIRFMDGEKVALWSRVAWFGIYVFALFVFVHTVLHPRDNQVGTASEAQVIYLSVLLGALTLVAVSLWAFFLFHNRRKEKLTEEPAVT
jgi:hypothetical protein